MNVTAIDARDILGLTANSRTVRPGYLFAALQGLDRDGLDYLDDAVARGAAAILSRPDPRLQGLTLPVLTDPLPRRCLAQLCARFYAPLPRQLLAATGTNGKTSVVHFCRQLWRLLGTSGASIGTLGVEGADIATAIHHTTPDPETLCAALSELAAAGIEHVALEASSHGLDQYRLDGLQFAAAVFTSFSRDHLDYHADADSYFEAKARLFTDLLAEDGTAVVNIAAERADDIVARVQASGRALIRYAAADVDADIRLTQRTPTAGGQTLTIDAFGAEATLTVPLVGAFQAENLLAALGLLAAAGVDVDRVLAVLPQIKGVRGRLEDAGEARRGGRVYVDYSHTPDGLRVALQALRPHTQGRLIVAFGAGGDRDPGKRVAMGEAARRLADHVIVTDDNPRTEDPAAIRKAVLRGCPEATEIGDRAQAIAAGIDLLQAGDVFLIAGKGHETGQDVGGQVLPFDDIAVARGLLEAQS